MSGVFESAHVVNGFSPVDLSLVFQCALHDCVSLGVDQQKTRKDCEITDNAALNDVVVSRRNKQVENRSEHHYHDHRSFNQTSAWLHGPVVHYYNPTLCPPLGPVSYHTAARPVCNDRPPLIVKNSTTAITAVTSHSSILTKSIHTALFILLTPPSLPGFS